jgi:tripartite-type tricarboxylate transporter receptor subunit TctC
LAFTSSKRDANPPGTPTLIESGVPIDVMGRYGFCALASVPKPILEKWHADMVRAPNSPDVHQRLEDRGFDVEPQTPEQFAARIRAETAKWAKVVKDAHVSVRPAQRTPRSS